MKRMAVALLLISAASAADCTELDSSDIGLDRYGARVMSQVSMPRSWPCCAMSCRPASSVIEMRCFGADGDGSFDARLSNEFRDHDGLKRDTYYFLGYQVVAIGVLYLMPESVSSWSDEDKDEYSASKWWYNVTHPVWDEDDFFLNYVTHPYWGAAYFVRARERGYSKPEAFWYSAMLSSFYEFGAEALFEPVSIQDMIFTPVLGSLVGNYFMSVREGVRRRSIERGRRGAGDKVLWVVTDPLGAINGQIDRWLGHDVDLQIRPRLELNRRVSVSTRGPVQWESDKSFELTFSLRW